MILLCRKQCLVILKLFNLVDDWFSPPWPQNKACGIGFTVLWWSKKVLLAGIFIELRVESVLVGNKRYALGHLLTHA